MRLYLIEILTSLMLLVSGALSARAVDTNIHGIVFRGNDYNVDARTALRMPAEGELVWDGYSMKLEFDLKISRHGDHFGYVCSINMGDDESVSLFLTNPPNGSPYLCAVDNGGQLRPIRGKNHPIDIYEWNRIKLMLYADGDSLVVSENGKRMFAIAHVAGDVPVAVTFGKGYAFGKSHIDVAPMEVRDINLWIGENQNYLFPLAKSHADSVVYDSSRRLGARIENHEWIIDEHSRWKLVRSIPLTQKAYPVAAPNSPNLYLVTGDRVVLVNLIKHRVAEFKYPRHVDMAKVPNQFMVLGKPQREKLVYYSIENADNASAKVALFDIASSTWSPDISPKGWSSYINHSRYLTGGDSVIVQMFGYGYHAYKKEFNKIHLNGDMETDSMVLRDVAPRYLSATGRVDSSHVMIFGGIGNIYGDQEFGTRTFNDLYILDTDADSLHKLLDNTDTYNEISVDNLIYNAEANTLMGLFYSPFKANTSLTLKELDIATGGLSTLSDSIPYMFNDMNSSALLLHLPQTDMLYAVTVCRNADGDGYMANIYVLHLPLLPYAASAEDISDRQGSLWWWILASMVLMACGAGYLYVRRQSKRERATASPATATAAPADDVAATVATVAVTGNQPKPVEPQMKASAELALLGGFKVVNGKGENITGSFTPILRQILILIVLYTEKTGAGISNALLKDFLWYDKSDESFLNNRSVNIRKLRVILPEIGNLKLNVSHGNWSIDADDRSMIDYFSAMAILKSVKGKAADADAATVTKIIEYASRGTLLPECHFEWLDAFKADYSDMMIQTLHAILGGDVAEGNPELALGVANCILKFDSIDEDAVRAKCRILLKVNRVGSAGRAFERFVKEYRLLMNEEFDQSFNEFVGE